MRTALISALGVMLMLSACAKPPSQTRNACAIFEQRDGLFNNWRRAAIAAEREYGVPVPILMATIYTESSFRHNAKPPRKMILGFIPASDSRAPMVIPRRLTALERYQRETRRWGARRTTLPTHIASSAGITRQTADTEHPAQRPLQALSRLSLRPHRLSARRLQQASRKPCAVRSGLLRSPIPTQAAAAVPGLKLER